MRTLRGVAAAPGMASAPPALLEPASGSGAPLLTLDAAVEESCRQLDLLAARLRDRGLPDESEILEAQALMAADPELLEAAGRRITAGMAADDAILAAGEDAAAVLDELSDELLAARAADVRDVAARIARAVRGEAPPQLSRRSILVARDLTPSTTAELDQSLLAGLALEGGSPTAHAAILARALGIPAVVGVAGLLAAASGAAELMVDGNAGLVMLEPGAEDRQRLAHWETEHAARLDAERALHHRLLATADGHRVMLGANIGSPHDASLALRAGAEGVGLFRTEFVFMGRRRAPDEQTQAAAYAQVLRDFGERPVVIRLMDIGGDKPLPFVVLEPEPNPFLGVRAIRLAEREPELLSTQLRAIVRAAAEAGVPRPLIMAPMVADLADVRRVRALLDEAVAAVGAAVTPQLGIMVEVPSAIVVADQLADEVAFFSVGTNDLTQYLLAADRTNAALAERQDPMHPAVLRSIASLVAAAAPRGVPVAVCGEMGGDPVGAVVLTGLGVSELSMGPASFGAVKRALASVTLAEAQELAKRCLDAPDPATSRAWVSERLAV